MSWVLLTQGTAHALAAWLPTVTTSPLLYLLFVNVLLIVVGCIIETLPAMLITVPILLPTALALGIDPVHFGIVVIFNLLVGIMTPPMGIGLYILIAVSEIKFFCRAKSSSAPWCGPACPSSSPSWWPFSSSPTYRNSAFSFPISY